MLQQVTAEVQPMLAAQVNTVVSLDRTHMVNITFSVTSSALDIYDKAHLTHRWEKKS